ncbi:cytochrome c [Oceaniovalibus sp. ACAM 378]|uniref:c-type cytochrome n=1 Tax=Oceaniovalibus sp. ACAM 378 TaxID=2599923 RepID=UPI0011D5AE9B|nr:cytochrome c [Oceaniovalibus sp. ACAM 378]TYB90047.1 cytochrome c [Oceaniovalibus sp. ACAM 378]
MTSGTTGIFAAFISLAAVAALAHSGATGVGLERMTGMTAMRDIVSELAPMMQGTVPYNAFVVSDGGAVIAGHAGDTMMALFPEGSLEGVTYAKPEIWVKWRDFSAMAQELRVYAEALSKAAPNGLQPATPPPNAMADMVHSGMAMATTPPAEKSFTVAELMGYGGPADTASFARATINSATLEVDLASLAADDLFQRITATCSSCHAQFRAGRS